MFLIQGHGFSVVGGSHANSFAFQLSHTEPAVFSLFISTTGKRVFQSGRALVGIILLIMSAQCIIWKRNLLQFSPLHTDSFALTQFFMSIIIRSEFVKTNVHDYFSFNS